MQSVWQVHPADPQRAERLARPLGIQPLTAQLLLNRGIDDATDGRRFLQPTLSMFNDPWVLPDMEPAVRRLREAMAAREPILIFGDSDVDGLTASVILYEVLRDQGAIVRAKPSNRIRHGYGLPRTAISQLRRSATKLLILVDCGTNQPDEIAQLAASGIETIIVDHHVPLDRWAEPIALINPHRGTGAGRELCSAGLALKVAQALLGTAGASRLAASVDLAALGTLADYAPLIGENRIIVSEGLTRIVRSHRPGLQRLCELTRTREPEPDQVIRRLLPRLNASGRLGDASAVWHSLFGEQEGELEAWVSATGTAHETTKQLHRHMIAEAQEQVNRLHFRDQLVMVVSRNGWHPGLVGPVAAQLAQRYGRPAIAIAMDGRYGVGSGRSIPRFNLLEALRACQGLLVRFGGHAQACGLTVEHRHLESFRVLLNQHVHQSLGRQGLLRVRPIDLELPLDRIAPRWVEEAVRLAPFGAGNPRPSVLLRRVTLNATSARMALLSDGTRQVVVRGSCAAFPPGREYDVVVSPSLMKEELVLTMQDARGALAPSEPAQT